MSVTLRKPQPLLPLAYRAFCRLGQVDFFTLPEAIQFAISQSDRDAYIEHLWTGECAWSYRTHS